MWVSVVRAKEIAVGCESALMGVFDFLQLDNKLRGGISTAKI